MHWLEEESGYIRSRSYFSNFKSVWYIKTQTAGGLSLFFYSIISSMLHWIKRNLTFKISFIFRLIQTCSAYDSEDCSWQDENNRMTRKLPGL